MAFFRYLFKQSEKGLGKAFLFSILLGFIFALSVLVISVRYISKLDDSTIKKFADETGCKIVNYQLTCNEDYYEYDDLIIDLNWDDDSLFNDKVILTRDKILFENRINSYEQLLTGLNHGPYMNANDFIDFLGAFSALIYIFGFLGAFVGATIFFIIANTILALVMMGIINASMKTYFKYDQMFKLTIYTSLPYVTFNALTRMIFHESLFGYITSFVPLGGFLRVIIDYTIIFALTYLAVKVGFNKTEENNTELQLDVE
ncbi:DUF1189 family protein [Mycoplasmatota bacterium]|nr:DUF1189 family protein [Mycoplasmatota bacterium]